MTHWTDELVQLGACEDAIGWARTFPDIQSAWNACPRAGWMLWYLKRCGVDQARYWEAVNAIQGVWGQEAILRKHFPNVALPSTKPRTA